MTPMKHTALVTALLALLGNPMHAGAADNTAPAAWHPQRVITADFAFSVHATVDEDGRYAVDAIRIVDRRTGTVVQQIERIDGMAASGTPEELIFVVDANFDGRPDLSLPLGNGGAGPNATSNFYLFDPVSAQFVLHEALSELPQPGINPQGTIESGSRGSCCEHYYQTYRFEHGRLKLIAESSDYYSPDGWLETTSRKLVRGRWRTSTKRVRQPDQ